MESIRTGEASPSVDAVIQEELDAAVAGGVEDELEREFDAEFGAIVASWVAEQKQFGTVSGMAREIAWRSMVAEVAVATRQADRTVQAAMGRASRLVSSLPATLEALECGRITLNHARVILEHADGIEPDALTDYEDSVVPQAEHTTPGKLAGTAKIAAARLRAGTFEERHAKARELRAVTIRDLAEGIRAEVAILIPALTLLGESAEPVTLLGRGPIDLDTACRLASQASELVRVLTHPVSGMVVTADTYRPTASLRRYLEHRDRHCQFPVCNRDARYADIDHTVPWEHGGKTVPENLAVLCRGHHTVKHHGGWTVKQLTPGVLEWTTPLGRTIRGDGTRGDPPKPRFTEKPSTPDDNNEPPPF